MEIAVLVGPNGETTLMQEANQIQVYQSSCKIWEMCRSMPFSLESTQGLPGMREYMKNVLEFLGECRTLVGLSVTGLLFFELEKAGFTIWEIAGSPLHVIDSILTAEANAKTELNFSNEINISVPRPEPEMISPGCYSISLKDIQNCNGMVTSKQILFPLLKNMDFRSLEIICTHVPPWLEQQILIGQLTGQVNKMNHQETRVSINGRQTNYPK